MNKESFKIRANRARQMLRAIDLRGALLVTTSTDQLATADQHFPFVGDNNFFYFTGFQGRDLCLLIFKDRSPLLFAKPYDTHRAIWDGAEESPKSVARRVGAELVINSDLVSAVLEALRGYEVVYAQTGKNGVSERVIERLLKTAPHARGKLPGGVFGADLITTPMRLIKDRSEVKLIKEAASLTDYALAFAAGGIRPGVTEAEIADSFESFVKRGGGSMAFEPIVAAGANSAVLHYRPGRQRLKSGELVLCDIGAKLAGYCGDLSRTFPVSGRFTKIQRSHYEAVLSVQLAVIKKIKAGIKLQELNLLAEELLLDKALSLGVIKGKVKTLIKDKAIKKFYPHSIGHSLGLDVHDPQRLLGDRALVLEAGMVITVEPGLYFHSPLKGFVGGVRIEDDILVEKSGGKVLSHFPKSCDEIEDLLN